MNLSWKKFEEEGEEEMVSRLSHQLFAWSDALSFREMQNNELLMRSIEELERTFKNAGFCLCDSEKESDLWT